MENRDKQPKHEAPHPQESAAAGPGDGGPLDGGPLDGGPLDRLGFGSGGVPALIWQRLVGNELSDQDYRALLQRMEAEPGLWRDCALAFLEEQAIRQALAGWGDAPGQPAVSSARNVGSVQDNWSNDLGLNVSARSFEEFKEFEASGYAEATGDGGASDAGSELVELPDSARRRSDSGPHSASFANVIARMPYAVPLASAAAGFLLAFTTLGNRAFDDWFPPVVSQRQGLDNLPSVDSADSLLATDGATENDRRPGGLESRQGADQRPEAMAPLMADWQLASFMSELSDEERRQLLSRPNQRKISATVPVTPVARVPGQLVAHRRFLFIRLPNGSPLVVPVDDYLFTAFDFQ
jgi:hypothetical protein